MPAETFELVSTSDPGWDERLQGVDHDFYHRRGYHALAEWNGEGEAFLAIYRQAGVLLAWPYLRRPIPGTDLFDVGCVYGYPGPVGAGLDATTGSAAWRLLTDVWRAQGIISVFTSFNPLLGNARLADGWTADPSGPEPVIAVGRSVAIDLARTRDERLTAYEKETRYEIGRARRAGLTTHVDSVGTHLDDLARLYERTMQRNEADERYRFSRDYFEHLWAALDGRGHLLVAHLDDDDVVGVLLFVVDGELGHAHLTGVSDEHLRLSPLNAMLDATADAARDLGARVLHLGAGRGGREDSLYRFKRRIGDVERAFEIGRWVLDGRRYAELSRAAGVGPAAAAAFFPAYRAVPAT